MRTEELEMNGIEADEIIYRAVLEDFAVVPYTRMTGPGRFSKRAQRYLKNREAMAWKFKQFMSQPPILGNVILEFHLNRSTKRLADLDNFFKSIGDALQHARVIHNDNQIIGVENTRLHYGTENDSLLVFLWSVEYK